ncbi:MULTISPECIES: hypothetical protein [Carnobacterium]|uniref:Uncharacterized protein n=2 Tax=Carnobacterium inhibens TaxID=147709 RepID=U5S6L0_9LACT|nr:MULTISPECIES: hypothetical protein [Carnobacterium]AGY80834.1 hypothetical protein Q783_00295 [Carnobacterium inhibens subsp. gilichinskyi]MBC9825604.1 hypothetical protein [Carnobacterium inhibens]MCM3513154.1 hypothetical protein [Carnobacterium inhibens]
MEQKEWLLQELERVIQTSRDYKQKALLKAVRDLINEQVERIRQMEGELDGTLWSPRNWSE